MKYAPSKPPSECHSLAEIRTQIDQLDRGIIQALGERRRYVMAAGAFKTNPGEVAAPERVRAVQEERERWAEEEGLPRLASIANLMEVPSGGPTTVKGADWQRWRRRSAGRFRQPRRGLGGACEHVARKEAMPRAPGRSSM
jgi:isochorismate pyruvate lyase